MDHCRCNSAGSSSDVVALRFASCRQVGQSFEKTVLIPEQKTMITLSKDILLFITTTTFHGRFEDFI